MSRQIGDTGRQVVYGGYGHNPSGKQYSYWGSPNMRAGQQVVVPVTNKAGKTYNTMFTISRTSASKLGVKEAERLRKSGIRLKSVKGRDTLNDLPSGRIIKELGGTKTDWKEMSDTAYRQRIEQRLGRAFL